jgi:hypothetical protein
MTAPEPDDDQALADGVVPTRSAAAAQIIRAHRARLTGFTLFALVVGGLVFARAEFAAALWVGFAPLGYFTLQLPFRVRARRVEARRRIARAQHTRAARALGGVEVDEVRSTFGGRLRHVLRSSRASFIGGGVIGVALAGLGFASEFELGLGILVLWFISLAVAALLLTVRDALGFDKEAAADAQAEAAYREAIKDRAQLGGSLQMSAGSGEGGELSMAAQAGGLAEAHEVTLGLDEEAPAVARREDLAEVER